MIQLNMKKIVLILLLFSVLLVTLCYFSSLNKRKVENFANDIVDSSILLENVLKKRVKYSKKQKDMSLIFLKKIRDEYQVNPMRIVVNSSSEVQKEKDSIKLYEGEQLFYIEFNKSLTLPLIIDNKSQIILLFRFTKGGGGFLINSRYDGNTQ